MRLVFIGPPGVGKGTYAKMISTKYGIPHLSTGDIFREEISKGSELGLKVKYYVEKGLLVPDDIVIGIVRKVLKSPECERGFILDGFPRTIKQAEELDKITTLDAALLFEAPLQTIIERVSGRLVCPNCGAIYNISWKPPKKPGVCDVCGSVLVKRKDDDPEVIRARYETYRQTFSPVIEYYRSKGMLIEVYSAREAAEVVTEVEKILRERKIIK
ncbi:MAG: adenylate kinase [Ignisphaera sp.]|nr:adenylate kinase [Ignisphaera sp.]MCX8168176.1 adenylate kinase [Ignisphaera sp.]MDW8085184.1 adenylate kinase [Ignisphaera sp.]